jgi:cell division protein FtsB
MRGRLIWGALIVGALIFALQAGEYSTADIVRQHRRITALTVRGDSLQQTVDSLMREERMVRTNPATQEKIAREEFGMVRGDEILYRFLSDSADKP